jgi:hypothetical protein
MNIKSKSTPLIFLGITSALFSRLTFVFINDPEGPNLLIVIVLATVVYLLSLAFYKSNFLKDKTDRVWWVMLFQALFVAGLYLFLK